MTPRKVTADSLIVKKLEEKQGFQSVLTYISPVRGNVDR